MDNMRPVFMVKRTKNMLKRKARRDEGTNTIYMDNRCSSVSGLRGDVPMCIYDCNIKYK
jgi:hypothetical protein